ncbi:nuclease-related domain-containing protein [Halalkalibacter alkalisediminis]|uniref:Nuclease-related domain-containing protein n=1 Tax=Halalkalibacter alkalisediminis TaxID=935616 RepID=A0ABV6NES5_9BACI|nr:nuclease-related domain-containing protein [Halalkalibacter alkalisediminis]
MIIKKRETTLAIEKLQALLRRLPSHHPLLPEIADELSNRLAGESGENSIDYPLSFLPSEDYFIFHGLRLFHEPHFFQMDTLIVTRKFLLVIEVKNISGLLYFDQHLQQLIRTKKDGVRQIFSDPILQVKRQKSLLEGWLVRNHFPPIPVTSLVIMSNPLTAISSNLEHRELSQLVTHRDSLPDRVTRLSEEFLGKDLPLHDFKRLLMTLQKQHTPLDPAILTQFKLTTDDLKEGVLCPSCSYSPLPRVYGSWHCPRCQVKHKDAHVKALKDYALLFGTQITNREARKYLKLESDALVKRILNKVGRKHKGITKGSVYDLSHLRKESE